MFNRDTWTEILQTILKNPLRYILTGISMAVGIFILIFLLGMSSGLSNGVKTMFDGMAINSIEIEGGRTTLPYQGTKTNRSISFTEKDYAGIRKDYKKEFPSGSIKEQRWGMQMTYGKESEGYMLAGVNSTYIDLAKLNMTEGRFLNPNDENEVRKVVVLGADVHKDLCKSKSVIGDYLTISGVKFKIIGVFKKGESRWNNRKCYIPIQTYLKLFSATDRVDDFVFDTGALTTAESVIAENNIVDQLKVRYKINPEDENGIYSGNNLVNNEEFSSVLLGIKLFVLVIGLMTLISGIIGISNIMSIVVKERTRELGIRKALGATPRKIVGLILQESLLITIISGFAGLILGVVVLEIIATEVEIDFFKNPAVDFNTAMLALIILILSGLVAGFIPSLRAARLKPIQALKEE